MNKAGYLKLRQWTAILAAAIVLSYVGTVAVTAVRDTAVWQADGMWLMVLAFICGGLVFVVTDGSFASVVAASLAAALIVTCLTYSVFLVFLGAYINPFELIVSNLFIVEVVPRSVVVLILSSLLGLVGGMAVAVIFPDHYPL